MALTVTHMSNIFTFAKKWSQIEIDINIYINRVLNRDMIRSISPDMGLKSAIVITPKLCTRLKPIANAFTFFYHRCRDSDIGKQRPERVLLTTLVCHQ